MAGYVGSSNRRNESDAFRAAVQAEVGEINTTLDGEIVSYDRATQRATIKIKLEQSIGGQTIQAPALEDIRVAMPSGGGFGAHYDLKSGDPVIVHVRQSNTDTSQTEGGNAQGGATRSFNLSDAIAYPGGGEDSDVMENMPAGGAHFGSKDGKSGLQARAGGSSAIVGGPSGSDKLTVSADGKIDLKSESGDSLLDIVRGALVLIKDHVNSGAPTDAGTQAAATALIAKIDGMKA
ncbi:hypothetical protein ASE63_22465 [Bosea sp. Root381]|uniref:Gp138 family membrane-puncturing spike protein n=1 Tax=Bosea sp. Root381 TaxID=1736524 RepID=UPI0007018820|nr:Gp138 family membrane-puncturing spike protein [Bosea sp. Root381]KRE07466.1 hypothetical protein ASE63_22465 [Bosea sp. Root381]